MPTLKPLSENVKKLTEHKHDFGVAISKEINEYLTKSKDLENDLYAFRAMMFTIKEHSSKALKISNNILKNSKETHEDFVTYDGTSYNPG